jgi:hypothetical protein
MSRPKITFRASDPIVREAFPVPEPAELRIPSWFRRQSKYVGGERGFMSRGAGARLNQSVRACPVVHDTMIAGYLMYSPCDIAVTVAQDGEVDFDCSSGAYCKISAHHAVQMSEMKFDRNFYREHVFKFQMEWAIDTPPGYSIMIMHPMYREDVPFTTLPGLIDTDGYGGAMNILFMLRRDFQGIIPAGTPIAQVIPFKREDWQHEITVSDPVKWSADYLKYESKFRGAYRKWAFKRKEWK